jgi:chromosome segregation ATPase
MKNRISQLEQQLRDKELELRKIQDGQGRLRENLKTVGASSQLGKRYLQKLNTEETEIDQLDEEIASLREQLTAKRDELANHLNNLDVG